MSDKKKIRANVRAFSDADYLESLSEKDREWYEKFNGEYYCNEINREGSIHRKELEGKTYICEKCQDEVDAFKKAKKETYDATNAQNRDSYGISSVGSYLKFLEDPKEFDNLTGPVKKLTNSMDPKDAFYIFLKEVTAEIKSENGRELDLILIEFSKELITLGASMTRQRINTVLRKRKNKLKESKIEK